MPGTFHLNTWQMRSRLVFRDNIVNSLADSCTKSGRNIEASMASTCLENFEDLRKRGIDKEVISVVAGMVYFGKYFRIVECSARAESSP